MNMPVFPTSFLVYFESYMVYMVPYTSYMLRPTPRTLDLAPRTPDTPPHPLPATYTIKQKLCRGALLIRNTPPPRTLS